jgi:hypothetical protein
VFFFLFVAYAQVRRVTSACTTVHKTTEQQIKEALLRTKSNVHSDTAVDSGVGAASVRPSAGCSTALPPGDTTATGRPDPDPGLGPELTHEQRRVSGPGCKSPVSKLASPGATNSPTEVHTGVVPKLAHNASERMIKTTEQEKDELRTKIDFSANGRGGNDKSCLSRRAAPTKSAANGEVVSDAGESCVKKLPSQQQPLLPPPPQQQQPSEEKEKEKEPGVSGSVSVEPIAGQDGRRGAEAVSNGLGLNVEDKGLDEDVAVASGTEGKVPSKTAAATVHVENGMIMWYRIASPTAQATDQDSEWEWPVVVFKDWEVSFLRLPKFVPYPRHLAS